MKASVLAALGQMASAGGNYFGQLHAETQRTKRAQDARTEAERLRTVKREEALQDRDVARQQMKEDYSWKKRTDMQYAQPKAGPGETYGDIREVVDDEGNRQLIRLGNQGSQMEVEGYSMPSKAGSQKDSQYKTQLSMRVKTAAAAIHEMDKIMQEGYDPTGIGAYKDSKTAGKGVLNFLASSEGQQYNSAGQRAISTFLRTDTGAAAPEAEQQRYEAMLLPQPGDSDEQARQKRLALQTGLEAMQAAASNGATNLNEAFKATVEAALQQKDDAAWAEIERAYGGG